MFSNAWLAQERTVFGASRLSLKARAGVFREIAVIVRVSYFDPHSVEARNEKTHMWMNGGSWWETLHTLHAHHADDPPPTPPTNVSPN